MKENFPENKEFYILESKSNCIDSIPAEDRAGFELCYQTEGETARDESYRLYRVTLK